MAETMRPTRMMPLPEAARALDIHYQTAWAWATAALMGEPSRFRRERLYRSVSRRIFVASDEVMRLRDEALETLLAD